ncbi:MAG: cell wall-binding repeat-containing protein, partial [Lachnospiraceae bacterium]|nr:cell wall-binding repeat-containing protein [Lachnospiraceae bacterium]
MKQWKMGLWILSVLTLTLAFVLGGASASPRTSDTIEETKAVSYTESGRESVKKPSMCELRKLLQEIPEVTSYYAVEPVVTGPDYRPGTLEPEGYANALAWINYYRRAAGLKLVAFTDALNESAAYGALADAAINQLTHNPTKPSDMPDEVFAKGYYATSHSNISFSYGYGIANVLRVAIRGQMADESAGNVPMLGHRRWLLNPGVQTMGVGSANNGGSYYTAVRVFGDDVEEESVTDYAFVSWPASGNNLSDTFESSVPWSVTLNPDRYGRPDRSQVKVVLTRESDGKVWTFDSSTDTSNVGAAYDYFNVDNMGYGVSNCIIFRPAYNDLPAYDGRYTVDVSGITDRTGNAAEIHYQVLFTASSSDVGHDYKLTKWNWAGDKRSASALFTCQYDPSHTVTLDAAVTVKTTAATCEAEGKTVYTATVTLDGKTYKDEKEESLPATGHNWNTPVITWEGYESAKAVRTCKRNTSHKETAACTITSKVTKEPTVTEAGEKTYTARAVFGDGTVSQDVKIQMLPPLRNIWTRLAGANRFDTMEKVLQEAYPEKNSCTSLVVASGMDFADALTGASLAGALECPIVLTSDVRLLPYTKNEIERLAAPGCKVYVLGGT